jgi:polysaccharide pyruvyl transferase WcaK-like protein
MKRNILLVNDTSLVSHHGCFLLMMCIYRLFKKNDIIIKDQIYFEEDFTKYLKKKINYDLILINGEGTIHGSNNSDKKKVNEIFKFIKFIKRNYEIPVVIFNSTISHLNKNQLKILKTVDKIYVREHYSYNYLEINKIKSRIVPDLLSLLEFKDNPVGEYIIVNDSSIKINNLKLKEFSKKNNYKYIPILYNNYLRYLRYLICKLIKKYKSKFIIKLFLIIKKYHTLKFLDKVNNSKFIITGRFHAVFIALSRKKPFYTFEGNTYKIRGLMEMIGLKNRFLDINSLKNESIFIKKFTETEIQKIKKFQKKTRDKIKIFVKELKNI